MAFKGRDKQKQRKAVMAKLKLNDLKLQKSQLLAVQKNLKPKPTVIKIHGKTLNKAATSSLKQRIAMVAALREDGGISKKRLNQLIKSNKR